MNTKLVELEALEDETAVVWVLWAGIKSIASTHHIYCICSKEKYAIQRVKAYEAKEKDYYEGYEAEYWYERVCVDHLVGETMLLKAREFLRKQRTGD